MENRNTCLLKFSIPEIEKSVKKISIRIMFEKLKETMIFRFSLKKILEKAYLDILENLTK